MELLNNYKIVYIEKINKINKSIYNIITMFISIKHFRKLQNNHSTYTYDFI